jgi:hypothetical protein
LTRQVTTTLSVGGTTTVNVEPLGTDRLDMVHRFDLRVSKGFPLRYGTIDASVDFHNLFNVNTAWEARTLSGTINLRQDGLPTGAINTVPQYLSPAGIVAPRIIRFNVAYRF